MAKIIATRSAQYPLVAHQVLNFSDWTVDSVTGTKKTFGSTVALSSDPTEPSLTSGKNGTVTFTLFNMPRGAIITGGYVVVETAATTAGSYTMNIGDGTTMAKYVSAFDWEATTAAAFTITTNVTLGASAGTNISCELVISNNDVSTGKVHVYVMYIIEGKANEVVPN